MNRQTLQKSFSQLFAEKVTLNNEADGARWGKALMKAIIEAEENRSVSFTNGVLRFTSRWSGEKRIVTKSGCVKSLCPCGDAISYHRALYSLLERYEKLTPKHEDSTALYVSGGYRKADEKVEGFRL